ncbi:acyltransferase [Rhodopirellula sp.]|nr:acyltransferase [Rhodopirellula sp.]
MKRVLRGLAVIVVSPLIASFYLCALAIGKDRSLESHSQTLSLLPGITGNYLRTAFYRFALESCHPSATISFGTLFSKAAARIEKNTYIGPHCMLGWVHLQEDVLLGPYVQIPSGPMTHGIERLDVPIRLQPGERKQITIGRDSWIGAGSIVLADVAEQNVIAAGSVVTKPTDPATINAGIPSERLKARSSPDREMGT